ncbi:MAG: sugar transferase [Lachnospiraceae bacterium]|nr:sugar transferase [Lachnospiraceae bacterium]
MYKKNGQSWLKHLDFTIFDLIVLAAVYILVVLFRHNFVLSPTRISLFTRLGVIMLVFYLLIALITQTYQSILQRDKKSELIRVFVQIALTMLMLNLYMFITKQSSLFSRTVFGLTAIFGIICIYGYRLLWKNFLRRRIRRNGVMPWLLIVTDASHLSFCKEAVSAKPYNPFGVKGIALLDEDRVGEKELARLDSSAEYEIVCNNENLKSYVLAEVVDEVFIALSNEQQERELVSYFLEAGITVRIGVLNKTEDLPNVSVEKMGDVAVITTSNNVAAPWQLFLKRLLDIFAGLVGVIITGILYLILAPMIKAKDPGPAFFKQIRIGKNGRKFYFYKFRSMYTDAEERKKELMEQNEMDGFMFKMKNDPRIIPGIGQKIRAWSLDEFPQFINVLKGDMSLIGTRPPTLEEFERYEAHHKARLSFKPGITGLWQVSGRNQITDFEEVVRLDNTYIRTWNIRLDLKILFKTFKVVLQRKGAK